MQLPHLGLSPFFVPLLSSSESLLSFPILIHRYLHYDAKYCANFTAEQLGLAQPIPATAEAQNHTFSSRSHGRILHPLGRDCSDERLIQVFHRIRCSSADHLAVHPQKCAVWRSDKQLQLNHTMCDQVWWSVRSTPKPTPSQRMLSGDTILAPNWLYLRQSIYSVSVQLRKRGTHLQLNFSNELTSHYECWFNGSIRTQNSLRIGSSKHWA